MKPNTAHQPRHPSLSKVRHLPWYWLWRATSWCASVCPVCGQIDRRWGREVGQHEACRKRMEQEGKEVPMANRAASPTPRQIQRVTQDFRRHAGGEPVDIEFVDGTMWVWSSELGCYRIQHKMAAGKVGFSKNMRRWYYSLEVNLYAPTHEELDGEVGHGANQRQSKPMVQVGTTVAVPDPISDRDSWHHAFVGTVIALTDELATVCDQDDDAFDVEVERLFPYD